MTDVLDLLVAAGARITSLEEAAAAGDVSQWLPSASNEQTKIRALVMAVDHQRIDVIDELIHAGTPFDGADVSWGRHPLRLAAVNGRVNSVRSLLAHGADRTLRDGEGLSALDHCRAGLTNGLDTKSYHAIEALLTSV